MAKMQYDLLIRKLKPYSGDIKQSRIRYGYDASFMLLPSDWKKYAKAVENENFTWQYVKFSRYADIPNVNANTPGIYLFVLKPPHDIFQPYNFVMYVGMTKVGLQERLKTGYRAPSQVKGRQNIMRLLLDYGRNLYWYYAPFPGYNSVQLEAIESDLIGYFGEPPINIRDKPTPIANATKSKIN